MRHLPIVSVLLLMFPAFSSIALAQTAPARPRPEKPGLEVPLVTPGPGWKACPRCKNDAYAELDRKKAAVETRKFNPHDISGIWSGSFQDLGANGTALDSNTLPPFTPYGRKLYEANISNSFEWNSKDPMALCDPLGYPRTLTYNYGIEFIQLPDRVLEFFENGHTFRTIWTDGRALPPDPPNARYYGYAVGRWEGDTFVVESNGYDDKTWLIEDSAGYTAKRSNPENKQAGLPHSDEMRIVERYRRLNYGKLELTVTITDPKVYTAPWTTASKFITLSPNSELGEKLCVPSDSIDFNNRNTLPTLSGK
jgi:hypothetical protein